MKKYYLCENPPSSNNWNRRALQLKEEAWRVSISWELHHQRFWWWLWCWWWQWWWSSQFHSTAKSFWKITRNKVESMKIFKEIRIGARLIKCSVHYLIWHLSDIYFVCADPVAHFLGHSRGPFHHTFSSQVKTL